MQTVHVIFKTHLDVGFTDFAETILRKYIDSYIPQAIQRARELRELGGEERFVWTTGSWLIYEYLEKAPAAERAAMEQAIAAGDIRWHALPFTTHTEAMSPTLFREGLKLSQSLDARFGVKTIAAKMTDVPGHTRSMVPLMAEAGVRFLHLGVNPASRAPDVPDVFRWRDEASGGELLVMYNKGSYGSSVQVDGLDHALTFAHTGDNYGPQSREKIVEQFAGLRDTYTGARLLASTLDAFASELESVREMMPVITEELGDNWIHGIGTDPKKLAEYRQLCRLQDHWLKRHVQGASSGFSRQLLMVPEHTWGLDEKTHLGDYVNYTRPDFGEARAHDVADSPVPEVLAYARKFPDVPGSFKRLETSWKEQRAYVTNAVKVLPDDLKKEAIEALEELTPWRPILDAVQWLDPGAAIETRQYSLRIGANGALCQLTSKDTGRDLAGKDGLGLLRYQTLSAGDYDRYLSSYSINLEHEWCSEWAIPDFSKPGLKPSDSPSAMYEPRAVRVGRRPSETSDTILVELAFAPELHEQFGAPATAWIAIILPHASADIRMRLQWFDKPANRMPEALWFSFCPIVTDPASWRIDKLGAPISPLEVIKDGNRNLHGFNSGLTCDLLGIESLDAGLVAPGRPRLLEFDNTQPDLSGGMHINLYNNIWGTNFPMWYEDDALFRFILHPRGAVS